LSIHPSVIASDRAKIHPDAEIGPYCVIDGEVEIGAGTVVESHARIGSRYGRVTIGSNNRIQHGAVLGGPPQDLGYEGGAYTALEIGSHNRIGEYVTINLGTAKGGGVTRVGNHNSSWRTRTSATIAKSPSTSSSSTAHSSRGT
jgi:UDP-N-acetylglucosamine acyltransferase